MYKDVIPGYRLNDPALPRSAMTQLDLAELKAWLGYQDEIGRRHHRVGKNRTDGVAAAAHVRMRHLLALVM